MAGKADFTEEEWEQLRKGETGAGLLVSGSDRSFLDTFKEAKSLASYLKGSRDAETVASSADGGDEVEEATVERIRAALA